MQTKETVLLIEDEENISDFMAMDHRAFWQLEARTDSICL